MNSGGIETEQIWTPQQEAVYNAIIPAIRMMGAATRSPNQWQAPSERGYLPFPPMYNQAGGMFSPTQPINYPMQQQATPMPVDDYGPYEPVMPGVSPTHWANTVLGTDRVNLSMIGSNEWSRLIKANPAMARKLAEQRRMGTTFNINLARTQYQHGLPYRVDPLPGTPIDTMRRLVDQFGVDWDLSNYGKTER